MMFGGGLGGMGQEARTSAYRRDNPLYKNRSTKATYQLFILRRLERACVAYRPDFELVIKGWPVTPGLVRLVTSRISPPLPYLLPPHPIVRSTVFTTRHTPTALPHALSPHPPPPPQVPLYT